MKSIENTHPTSAWRTALRRIRNFATCESGASTAEFVLVGAVCVALGVSVVITTKDSTRVSTAKTNAALIQDGPEFAKFARHQQNVAEEYRAHTTGASYSTGGVPTGGYSTDDPYAQYDNPTGVPAGGETETQADTETADTETETAGEETAADQSGDQSDTEQSTEGTDQGGEETQTASNETGTEDGSSGGSGGGSDVEFLDTPGCVNPFDANGLIKPQCIAD